MSGVIGLIVALALVGLLVWAVIKLVPMPGQIANAIIVVGVVVCVFIVLNAFGLVPAGMPRLR